MWLNITDGVLNLTDSVLAKDKTLGYEQTYNIETHSF